MMRGVVTGGTATAANGLPHPIAGKTGTVNDHTDVWFIGYSPTYVTGVWMGYPGRKKNLGTGMTGGVGALPYFVEFMRDFLKDKPKEEFPKAPSMPEDMREMYRQRQRELQLERAQMQAEPSPTPEDGATEPSAITTPKLEDTTLPPAPKQDQPAEPRTDPVSKPQIPPAEAPRQETRPREAEPAKKKGKKGEPDGP
jgi:penicillin-binding protein 1A